MKNTKSVKLFIALMMFCLWVFPSSVHAQTQTIKVIKDNANIHLYPDSTSSVLGTAPLGQEYETETKVGEWYKIEFYSRVGVLMTGYIHQTDVSAEKEEKAAPAVTPAFKRVNIGLGGTLSLIGKMFNYEHSFAYREETFEAAVDWEPGGMFGFNGCVGVFVVPMLELSAGFGYFSKSSSGSLFIDIPSPFKFNDYESDEAETDMTFKATAISFGVHFFPVARGKMRPYLGAEGNYLNGKIKMADGFNYNETTYTDFTHSIEIVKIDYEEKNVSCFGFSFLAGVNYEIVKSLTAFLEGRYTLAKDKIKEPIYMDEMIEINMGGVGISGGIKFFF
jgi:opacity protein-like surface antigen